MQYRKLQIKEINNELFKKFERNQKVTQCLRKINDEWMVKDVSFIDQWSEDDYKELIEFLKKTLKKDGVIYGAFEENSLKGFVSVENGFIDEEQTYFDLSNIYVSEDMRGHGIGEKLFHMAAQWAKIHNAKKLYISAHSAVESQAFYKAMGCIEALKYNQQHVEKEPCDCQLEYVL
ncbi:N-acetylglutamate synthase, GNAT family [Clostridium cavendishii DSM 21758]|uniref:N-acetylglutamate synthase, GNAT family n=1 Tax=Clostridium cavendishii DSM 21758 TaxID=1121302 RepID=A0A1M6NLM8_9CLOT|nr:GNAT family N-acetyltransferase [Clostridium cavendishii]SHJ96621.1 N-acetylglutamate synthase, GNAT family [Clostridium cavendishii DSM 21758]